MLNGYRYDKLKSTLSIYLLDDGDSYKLESRDLIQILDGLSYYFRAHSYDPKLIDNILFKLLPDV